MRTAWYSVYTCTTSLNIHLTWNQIIFGDLLGNLNTQTQWMGTSILMLAYH